MISLNEANSIIQKNTKSIGIETISFLEAHGRILAQDIISTIDLPPFDRATVDGFALQSQNVQSAGKANPKTLKIIDIVQAGKPSLKEIKNGQAIKIMTGGVVPKGADCVVMKEDATLQGSFVKVLKMIKSNDGIAFCGDDIKKGNVILGHGMRLTPACIALLASLGIGRVKVFKKPRVAILVTGNELLNLKDKLKPGKIRSANQYGLSCQIKEVGGEPTILGIARDNLKETGEKVSQGLKYDMLIISGGVSVGDYDLVPQVLKERGVRFMIEKVAMQPGKPLIFGKKAKTYIFGLPGNPVSTMVCFYEFVRSCLLKMQGAHNTALNVAHALLDEDITLKPQRTKILRGVTSYRDGKIFVRRTTHQGSGNIISLAKANCLFKAPEGITRLKKGSVVEIEYLP